MKDGIVTIKGNRYSVPGIVAYGSIISLIIAAVFTPDNTLLIVTSLVLFFAAMLYLIHQTHRGTRADIEKATAVANGYVDDANRSILRHTLENIYAQRHSRGRWETLADVQPLVLTRIIQEDVEAMLPAIDVYVEERLRRARR